MCGQENGFSFHSQPTKNTPSSDFIIERGTTNNNPTIKKPVQLFTYKILLKFSLYSLQLVLHHH